MEITTVLWRERLFLKRRFWRVTFSQTVSPLLYFVISGMGLGRMVKMDRKPYLYCLIPRPLTITTMHSGYTLVSTHISVMCLHKKSFEYYLYSPTRMHLLAMGHIPAGALRGMYSGVFIVLLGIMLGVRLVMNGWLLTAVILNSPIFSALGSLVVMMMESHCDMDNFMNIVITPVSFLCGTFFSPDGIPEALKWVANIMPLTRTTRLIRKVSFDGSVNRLSTAAAVLFTAALTGGCMWVCYREAEA